MLIMHPMNNLKTESRISVIFMIPKTNKSIMWKHVGVEGKDVDLVIKNVSPETALPEMEVIPNIHIFSAMSKWTQGVVRFESTEEAMKAARQLVANGWNWEWD